MSSAFDIITSGSIGDDVVLSSVFEIENILLHITELNSKLDHLKGLKKFRVETADVEIKAIEEKISQFRDLIQRTMFALKPDENSLLFPAVGKVVRRKGSSSWSIKDEKAFLTYMQQEGRYDEVVNTKVTIDLRKAKKIVEDLMDSGDNVPGVVEVESPPSISITFETDTPKLSKTTTKVSKKTDKQPVVKSVQPELDDLDDLEV